MQRLTTLRHRALDPTCSQYKIKSFWSPVRTRFSISQLILPSDILLSLKL